MYLRTLFALGLSLSSIAASSAADITASRQTTASVKARAGEAEFRGLYRELIEINTTLSVGNCTDAKMARRKIISLSCKALGVAHPGQRCPGKRKSHRGQDFLPGLY